MTSKKRTATAGRERSCDQCGLTYHAVRANSRYCSSRCTKRAQREKQATPPAVAKGLRRWIIKRGYVGATGNGGCALTVPASMVVEDLNLEAARLHRERGLRSTAPSTKAGLKAALRDMRIAA